MVVWSQTYEFVGPSHDHHVPTLVSVMGQDPRYLVTGIVRVALTLIVIASVGIALDIVLLPPVKSPNYLPWLGVGLIAIWLFLDARSTFVLWTEGLGTPHPASPPSRLVDRGPYRYSRNPLYVPRSSVLTVVRF